MSQFLNQLIKSAYQASCAICLQNNDDDVPASPIKIQCKIDLSSIQHQRMNRPPLISRHAPVAEPASAEASSNTASAMKSALPSERVGMVRVMAFSFSAGTDSCTMGRSSGPGEIALTVTPLAASSRAKTLVSVSTPPLAAA